MDKERKLIMELADKALEWRLFDSIKKSPGETIQALPEEQREVLRNLKSHHVDNVMPFWLRYKK